MLNRLRQFDSRMRRGFTLVELLVVVAIFSILATLVVSGFTINNADRVGNSVATVKNAIEGARSRAVADGAVRGVRLIVDQNNPRIVTSMVYVESPGFDEGICNVEFVVGVGWRVVNVDDPVPATPNDPLNRPNDTWNDLNDRDLIQAGARIEIPRDSGNWYTVSAWFIDVVDDPVFGDPMTRDVIRIVESYRPSTYETVANPSPPPPTITRPVAINGNRIPYRLELAPTVAEGAEPILLDPQACIDLDGSRVPEAWRFREDVNRNGVIDGAESDTPPDGNGNGQFDFSLNYSPRMDILFASDGTVVGDVRTSGILHFRICEISDVILAEPLRQRALGDDFSTTPGYPNFITPVDPENEHKALSLFPQTGGIVVSEIDRRWDDGDTNGFNSIVDQDGTPFEFAVQGRESN